MCKSNGIIFKFKERWKLIKYINGEELNFNKNYYVSNYGRIKTENGKILSLNDRRDYYQITLYIDNKRKSFSVHKLVYETFFGKTINKGFEIHHKDFNSLNNFYLNLELLSIRDHKMIHGFRNTRYTKELILDIADNIVNGVAPAFFRETLGEKYGFEIKRSLVDDIRAKKAYKYLLEDYNFRSIGKYNRKYSKNTIQLICELLSQNCTNTYIVNYLQNNNTDIKKTHVNMIRNRTQYYDISKNYKFPYKSNMCISLDLTKRIKHGIDLGKDNEYILRRYNNYKLSERNINDIRNKKSYSHVIDY